MLIQIKSRCFATSGVTIHRRSPFIACRRPGRASPYIHHRKRMRSRRFSSRSGLTCRRTYSKGSSYCDASCSLIETPKSITQASRGRAVMSRPINRCFTTSRLGRPFVLTGAASIACAAAPSRSNGPAFIIPRKQYPRFSTSVTARVMSAVAVRSEWISETGTPSSVIPRSVPLSKPTIETRTDAPFRTHGRSPQAMKMPPLALMRSSTGRLPDCRIELVASNPTRRVFPATICARASSNQ